MHNLDQILDNLPLSPGCYLMKDSRGKIIYVGKAIVLRHRVRSDFQPGARHSQRIAMMVQRVADIDFIVTGSEVEALCLECTLIKRWHPRFNVKLRDDKRYPLLKFTDEAFPQLVECRKMAPDGCRYFGPYTASHAMRAVEKLIRRLFHIRRCTYAITPEFNLRPCLDHHIGLCDAPCAGLISPDDYAKQVALAVELLKGRADTLLVELDAHMQEAAANLEFERAADFRDLIADVKKVTERQRVVGDQFVNLDVLAVSQHEDVSCVQVLFVREGRVLGENHVMLDGTLDDNAGVPLRVFVTDYYNTTTDLPPTILLAAPIEDQEGVAAWLSDRAGRKVEVAVPERGQKRQLIALAQSNADEAMRQWLVDRDEQRQRAEAATSDLRERLNLPRTPFRLECYDIATLQGDQNVGSMVVFVDGRPAKGEYRQFKVRLEVDAPNDYEMMREVLTRRLQRAIDGDPKFLPLPDLLVVDGGKGQLGVAVEVCAAMGCQQIPLAGLAKQHEYIFVPGNPDPIVLEARMPALRLMRAIRDEAHRVANTFHQRLRTGHSLRSVLDDIPGVGLKRRTLLLTHFRSTQAIAAASVEEIAALPGMNAAVAEQIKAFLAGQVGDEPK